MLAERMGLTSDAYEVDWCVTATVAPPASKAFYNTRGEV
jgi:hypothetical protein